MRPMKASPKPTSVALAPSEACYNRVRFADSLDDDDEGDGADEAERRARAAATRDAAERAQFESEKGGVYLSGVCSHRGVHR